MTAYLSARRPVRDQWYEERRRPLTGCTVLHTSEGVMDTVGPDTGTESLAEFIRTRTTAGSYHDVADSDSNLQLVEYDYGAYHDGTGSNNWALSLSFVCRTVDWARMTPERRRGFLRQGALAFLRQQAYRRAVGAPLTAPRRITKAQSDRGESGFIYHGDRDPDRRTDPGVRPPAEFPFDEFITEVRAVMSGEEDDDMTPEQARMLTEVHKELTQRFPSRVPGSKYVDTVLGYAVNADAHGYLLRAQELPALRTELAGLRAAVTSLAGAAGVDPDDIKAHISTEVDRAMASFRERVAEGYEVRLEPKAGDTTA